jgi:hypothetical protein
MKWLLFTLLISAQALAADPKPKRWDELMKIVNDEMQILDHAKRKSPELHYRILELHSEKLKLIHEKNNKEFLALKSGKVKESYFSETRAYYNKTKDYGLALLKADGKNPFKASVMYVLALNSRDYGRDNITEKYLLDTISMVNDPHHSLRHHAETALADLYYNEKKYNEAITYYERAIKKVEDDWLSKHHFNLSWCYLKVHNFDKAIANIKEAYFLSKNPSYVNIKDQVLENVGSFFVYAGRPLDGLEFYLENERDPIPWLIPMAAKTADKGHEKETEKILASVQSLIDKHDWFKYQEELYQSYLDFYRHYNRFGDHEKTSRELVGYYKKAESEQGKKMKLPVVMKEEAIEKMRSLAGFLQVKLAKDMKADESNYSEKELDLVLNFFGHLIQLDTKKKFEYCYFRAETYYSVRRFKEAAPAYVEAVQESKIGKNLELARKSLNSLLALTGQEVLEKEENKKFLIFAYSEHIALWPRDEKSEQIYPKLYEIYHEAQDDQKAALVIRSYNKNYPEHLKEQQTFMTRVLDQFIEKKETAKLAHWIHEFKSGFLSFSKDTIEKTEIVLGNILFIQYQEVAKKGDKMAAAKGFQEIYVNKLYTDKVKYQSAFFASMIWLEMGDTHVSYNWLDLAHARMTEEERLEKRLEEAKIAERMFKLQDFKTSYKLSTDLLKKFCSMKDETLNRLFEVASMTALVEDKPKDAEDVSIQFSKCTSKPELKGQTQTLVYRWFEKQGDFFGLRSFVKRNSHEPFITQYRSSLQKWYWEKHDLNLKTNIIKEFQELKHPETIAWVKEIKQLEALKKDFTEMDEMVIWNKPAFDGEAFNKSLEAQLLRAQTFKQKYSALMQSEQVDLAILSTRLFSAMYLGLGEKIQGLAPAGMDAATMKDFKEAMKGLSAQFLTASKQFETQLAKALKDKETLSSGARSIASVEKIENPVFSFFTGLTMDKSKD